MEVSTILMGAAHSLAVVILITTGVWTSTNYLGGYAWDGSDNMMNYHILFMVLGMVFLYGEAALLYRTFKAAADKYRVKLAHGVMYLAAWTFTVTALVAVFHHKNKEHKTHLTSSHGWVGLTTVLMFSLQLCLGFLGFLWPKFSPAMRAVYLKLHQFFGSGIFVLVAAACVSGAGESFTHGAFRSMGNTIALLVCAFVLLVLYILGGDKEISETKVPAVVGTDNKSYEAKLPASNA